MLPEIKKMFKFNEFISKRTTRKTNKISRVNNKSHGVIYNQEEISFEKEST